MVRRTALLLVLSVGALNAVQAAEIAAVHHDGGWIALPGEAAGVVAVDIKAAPHETLRVRAELRPVLARDVLWSDEKTVICDGKGTGRVEFRPDATKGRPGDHSLRVALLPADGGEPILVRERALMLAEQGDLVLIFDQQPVARGLRFDKKDIHPKEIEVDGAKGWVHEMRFGSQQGGDGWWRSLLMTITDDAYRNGKRPVADIEVVYQHETNAGVNLKADTASGSREIAKGWGNSPTWQVLRASLTDARFSTPETGADPKKLDAEKCDLRYNACTTDGRIRSVRIHAPDAANPSDWSRFIGMTSFVSEKGWVLDPNSSDAVTVTIRNQARADWKGLLRMELCNADGRLLGAQEQDVRVDAQSEVRATVHYACDGEIGERLLRWRLLRGSKGNRQQDAGVERSAMVAGPEHAFILFEKDPIARGMTFERKHVAPAEITTGGLKRWIWKAGYNSSELGWWRSVRMSFTDDAFRDGAAPVVDVDVRYRQPAEAPTSLTADTASGGGVVASGWGGRGPSYVKDPPMKRLFAQIDDGVFGGTKRDGEEGENLANGCDLRYNACSVDGEIRSIIVKRYDLTGDVDWRRLLRHKGIDLGRENFVFEPGETIQANVKLANRARVPFQREAKVTLSTAYDDLVWEKALPVEIPPESEADMAVPVATEGFARGVYVLRSDIGGSVKTETLIGVSDREMLPKAREGEFYYGSDLGGKYSDDYKLDWADFMGVDMIRNCARGQEQTSRENLTAAIAELKRRGLRGHLMIDPPWHPDAAERVKRTDEVCDFLRWAAATHGDFLHWYEMGNEPDLPFFYAGPTDAYVEGYRKMYAAVKEKDPTAVVMNGGLCYHGKDGWRRAHEIVEKIPGGMIDAWAYHGHGPGAEAERKAWYRTDKSVRDVGKGDRDYIETESGLFANDPVTWRRQAQTIVQKAVFAQSKQAPTFFWFNLHMYGGDWGYTTVEREHEPRPAVLAHRTMVKCLRGLKHARELDLLAPESEAHLFRAQDGRRALVLWSDRGEITRTINIGPGCRDLQVVDLYDNCSAAVEAAPGLVQIGVSADPVFLVWTAGEPGFEVSIPPPPLALPDVLHVVPGRPGVLPVLARNPTDEPLNASLRVSVVGEAPVRFRADGPTLSVPARGEQKVSVDMDVEAVAPSCWPRQWTVFLPVPGEVDPRSYREIPKTILSQGRTVRPRIGLPDGSNLDLGRLNGGFSEKAQALCFAWVESDAEREIEIGAAADWWMEWFVNGERVYSTMDRGNKAPYEVLSHVFKAKLRQGRNLLAVRVLSGSGGWRLVAGGPDEIAAARRERSGQKDAVRVEMFVGDKLLAREPVPVNVLRPVERVEGSPDWRDLAIDGQLGEVTNLFKAVPDATRWHKGDDDLSGSIWLRQRGEDLVVAVWVRDDEPQAGDCCRIRLATGARFGVPEEIVVAGRRDDRQKATLYEAHIPKAKIGSDRFAIQVHVEDDDWGELKQHATWGRGGDAENWFQSWLR